MPKAEKYKNLPVELLTIIFAARRWWWLKCATCWFRKVFRTKTFRLRFIS